MQYVTLMNTIRMDDSFRKNAMIQSERKSRLIEKLTQNKNIVAKVYSIRSWGLFRG